MWVQFKKNLEKKGYSVKSLLALIIFALIILVFVFIDFPTQKLGVGGGAIGAAGQVNNSLISIADLQRETERMEEFYNRFLGGADMGAQRQFIKERALDNLINAEVIAQSAKTEGILSSDQEVRDVIVKDITAFQEEGRFQKDLYFRYLEATRSSPEEFESQIRKDRKINRMRQVFEASLAPLNREIELARKLEESKMRISFVRMDREEMVGKQAVSNQEIVAFLADASNKSRVESEFAANKGQYATPERLRAQHILVKVESSSPENWDKALKKIESIKQMTKSQDFGELALKMSEDLGSQSKKGDLGFFARGQMVPEFEQAAFAAELKQVVGPIKTQFGYHLIKVLEKQAAMEPVLSNHERDIAKRLLAETQVDGYLKSLEDALIAGDGSKANSLLKAQGLKFEDSEYFSLGAQTVPKLNASPVFLDSAFQVSADQPWLKRLVRDGSARYVLKFKDQKIEASKNSEVISAASIGRDRALATFEAWVEKARANSNVKRF